MAKPTGDRQAISKERVDEMQVKIFTMPFRFQLGVFDDEQFNEFSKDKELVDVSD